jgi:uncharacterized iron-regulated membrane protein
VLALLGLTGAILVHQDAWVSPAASSVQAVAPLSAIIAEATHDRSVLPDYIIFASSQFPFHRITYDDGSGRYLDRAGRTVTRWSSEWQRPELWIFDFHHHLLAGESGDWVIGIAALCGLFFVLSGAVLWSRTRRAFVLRLWPKRMTRSAITWQHRDLGIVVAPLLLLSLYTGAAMVFRPVTALAFGPTAPAAITRSLGPPRPLDAKLAARLDWAGIIARAQARFPDARIRTFSLPRRDAGLIVIRMKQPAEWLPNGRTTMFFAADAGRLIEVRDALKLPAQVRGFNLLYPLHAAKVGGLAYRLLMTISGLALTMLGGLSVWSFWFASSR